MARIGSFSKLLQAVCVCIILALLVVFLRKGGSDAKQARFIFTVIGEESKVFGLNISVDSTLILNKYKKIKIQYPPDAKSQCASLHPQTQYVTNGFIFRSDQLKVSLYEGKEPLIPKIIHQTWDTYDIPNESVKYVKSILRLHPDWEYWFWTQRDIRCYMKHMHGEYLSLFDSYPEVTYRANVMRYFVLYDFGGIYMDMDISALKPMDIWRYLGHAILSHETYEHSYILHKRGRPNVMNTVMASRPGHPYFKLLHENLPQFNKVCPDKRIPSTGVFFIDAVYQIYMNQLVESKNVSEKDLVTIIHPIHWLPTFGPLTKNTMEKDCVSETFLKSCDPKVLTLCEAFVNKHYGNVPTSQSYLNHHWAHAYEEGSSFKRSGKTSLFSLLPNLFPVVERLGLKC